MKYEVMVGSGGETKSYVRVKRTSNRGRALEYYNLFKSGGNDCVLLVDGKVVEVEDER
ncbi:MAG: hypothetical protein PHR78_07285 [Eubacteriales bacterium]|nr:hypothetical protein [Eubacteriales bacterium]